MHHFNLKRHALLFFVSFILFFPLPGCGKKAPPRAPGVAPLPPIDNLKSTTRGEILWLSWSIPEKMESKISEVVGFVIYRSKMAVSDSSCEGCPVAFKELTRVPVDGIFPSGIEKAIFSYEDVLEENHRYVYKITSLMENGRESLGSNHVTVTY
jgi:hypothetical protein